MKVEKTEADLLLELASERLASAALRVELANAKRELDTLKTVGEMARRKLSNENDELRAGLRASNGMIASNLELTHKLAEALSKTSTQLESAHTSINVLSALIEYHVNKK